VLEFSGSPLEATRTLVVAKPKESIEPQKKLKQGNDWTLNLK